MYVCMHGEVVARVGPVVRGMMVAHGSAASSHCIALARVRSLFVWVYTCGEAGVVTACA